MKDFFLKITKIRNHFKKTIITLYLKASYERERSAISQLSKYLSDIEHFHIKSLSLIHPDRYIILPIALKIKN